MADQNTASRSKSVDMKKYYKDTVAELKKVVWPNRQQVINSTAAVIGSVAIVGIFIWLFDGGLQLVISKYLLGM